MSKQREMHKSQKRIKLFSFIRCFEICIYQIISDDLLSVPGQRRVWLEKKIRERESSALAHRFSLSLDLYRSLSQSIVFFFFFGSKRIIKNENFNSLCCRLSVNKMWYFFMSLRYQTHALSAFLKCKNKFCNFTSKHPILLLSSIVICIFKWIKKRK